MTAQSVLGHLGGQLERAFGHEPPVGDAVADVFRRADAIRRRRGRVALAIAATVIAVCTILGYAVTAVLLPATPTPSPTADRVAARPPDPALALLAPILRASGLRVVPREPARGDGWRRYLVLTASGRPRGVVEISAYAAPAGLCYPVLAAPGACARAGHASDDVEYVRYAYDQDVDWQVNEVIARWLPDDRVIVVQATGERGTGTAQGGRPPLTALLASRIATDVRTAAAFGAEEPCNGPDPACPVLKVRVPVAE